MLFLSLVKPPYKVASCRLIYRMRKPQNNKHNTQTPWRPFCYDGLEWTTNSLWCISFSASEAFGNVGKVSTDCSRLLTVIKKSFFFFVCATVPWPFLGCCEKMSKPTTMFFSDNYVSGSGFLSTQFENDSERHFFFVFFLICYRTSEKQVWLRVILFHLRLINWKMLSLARLWMRLCAGTVSGCEAISSFSL